MEEGNEDCKTQKKKLLKMLMTGEYGGGGLGYIQFLMIDF
jgi:hypothetical protein